MDHKELLRNLDEVDALMKSQIVQGGNSERREWAGSGWEDEGVPSNTKNGTDYRPPRGATVAHKALADCTEEEIQQYLAMRKSRTPNPRAAEEEILALEGVTKSLCPSCSGAGRNEITKSLCDVCGGHGILFDCANEDVEKAVQDIADKYNVGGMDMGKAGPSGVDGDGDTTPAKMDPFEPVKLDNTGQMVGKGDDEPGEMMGEEMGEEEMEFGEDEAKAKKCAKSFEKAVTENLVSLTKGLKQMWAELQAIKKGQENTGEIVHRLGNHQVKMSKSLLAPVNGSADRAPARAPQAANTQVLSKGFVGSEPGAQGDGLRYSLPDIKKSASQMVYEGKLDPMEVYRLDSNVEVSEQTLRNIETWIDQNGVPQS